MCPLQKWWSDSRLRSRCNMRLSGSGGDLPFTASSPTSGGAQSLVMVVKTVIICILFMLVGPSLIMVNNYILKGGFPFPMFLSGLGVLATGLAARLLIFLGYDRLQRTDAVDGWLWYKRVLPLGFASAATLAFGNMVYLYLDVGFIQMLKSFTPVIMVCVSHFSRIELATTPVIISVAIICLGTAFTCSFVPQLNIFGLIIMLLSMSTEAARLSLTQFFLQQLKFGVIEGAYVMSPASAFWLFSASCFFELPRMVETNAFTHLFAHPSLFLVSAVMGVGVNFITYFMIQFTSSLTVKILVAVRNMLMVVVSVLFYGEIVNINQAFGYFVALLGFAGYNLSKMGYFKDYSYADFFHALPALLRLCLPSPTKVADEEGITLLGNNEI